MDWEVQDATDQPTTRYDKQQGWRSWFGKGSAPVSDEPADQGSDLDDYEPGGEAAAGDGQIPDVDALLPDDGPGVRPDELPGEVEPLRRQPAQPKRPRGKQLTFPLVARPLINPRLRADPRLRVWVTRTILCLVVFAAISMWKDWRYGLTGAVIFACADTLYRSKTTGITPSSARVTSAQRSTGRRLKVLKPAGYLALYARRIPGTDSVIDHVVVGPSGIFIVDSQRLDTRLPLRAIGGDLFHGPNSQAGKLDHARFEAEKAAALISTEFGQRVRVRRAMVIYGPKIPWVIMRLKGVDVFDGGHLSNYFRRQSKATAGHHLDTAQVALVFAAAAHALPSV